MAKRKGDLDIYTDNAYEVKKLGRNYQDKYNAFLNYLLSKEKDVFKINVYSSIALDDIKKGYENKVNSDKVIPEDFDKYLKSIKRSKRVEEKQAAIKKRDEEKFIISSLWLVFGFFLAITFIGEMLTNKYLIHFSIDAIVGAIGLAVGLRSLVIKTNIVKRYQLAQRFTAVDIISIIIAIALQILRVMGGAKIIDLTFPILAINYIFSVKTIKKIFNKNSAAD